MWPRRIASRTANAISWLAVTLSPALATAQDTPSPEKTAPDKPAPDEPACVAAFDRGQDHHAAGRLLAARDDFAVCSRSSCPSFINNKCVPWLAQVQKAMPTIVIVAHDPEGAQISAVRVSVDGTLLAATLDGRDLEVDPGEHEILFEHEGAQPVTQTVLVQQGVKNRFVEVIFEPVPIQLADPEAPTAHVATPRPPPQPRVVDAELRDEGAISPWFYVGLGLAGAGVTVGAIAGGVAASEHASLETECAAGSCSADDIAAAERIAHVSTVGFVAGGVGVALGLVALLVSIPEDDVQATANGMVIHF